MADWQESLKTVTIMVWDVDQYWMGDWLKYQSFLALHGSKGHFFLGFITCSTCLKPAAAYGEAGVVLPT
jgi:hypothetical protein